MLSAHRFLNEIIASLRDVIAPSIPDPYPRTQAYMAAVILEFVARQIEERGDIAEAKHKALTALFDDMRATVADCGGSGEARLCELIERLYAERDRLGEEAFHTANDRVRRCLRELLDQDLKIAGGKGE